MVEENVIPYYMWKSRLYLHQQTGGVDCGIFAIAFTTDGFDPVAVIYDQKMRNHLASCLEKQSFLPFPKI